MSNTASPRDLCIFGSSPNSAMRGEAGGWQWLNGKVNLCVDLFLSPAPAEQALAPHFKENWLCGGPKQSSVSQRLVEMPREALQLLEPTLCPAPGAVLSILLCSLVIQLSQDPALLKAALEKCQQKICCASTYCSESLWGLARPAAAGQDTDFLFSCWKCFVVPNSYCPERKWCQISYWMQFCKSALMLSLLELQASKRRLHE